LTPFRRRQKIRLLGQEVVMFKLASIAALIVLGSSSALIASQDQTAATASPADSAKIVCQYVLAPDPGAQPYQLCQSKAAWAAMEAQYAKDANRMVCHYEQLPDSRIGGHKVCGPLSAWQDRQAADRQSIEQIQMKSCVPSTPC
jgi:hypothetical protein